MHRLALAVIVVAAASFGVARASRGEPSSLAELRARWSEDRRALDEQLEALQARLLVDQARVRFWREMKERHESVAAVACTTQDRHAEAVARFDEQQRVKTAARARKNRVAVAHVATEDAVR